MAAIRRSATTYAAADGSELPMLLFEPDTLIVPMSLIRDAYRDEILGGLADAGEQVLHVFLELDAEVLRARLNARARPGWEWEKTAKQVGMTGIDEMVAAAVRQPRGTLMLRSDKLAPPELADKVMAAIAEG